LGYSFLVAVWDWSWGISVVLFEGLMGRLIQLLSSLVTTTFVMLNVASHPVSYSFPMDTRELCVRPGMKWTFCALCGSCGRSNVQSFVLDCSLAPWVGRL
jgi:hypothetical protein